MAFAQLTYRESLRDIEVCLAAQRQKLYHSGFSGPVRRATLADANETRDWRIYRDFAQSLIGIARPLYAHSELGVELDATAYAFDATTIDLCLSLFPWAKFRKHKGAIKLHTLLEIHSAIPVFIAITAGDVHEVNLLRDRRCTLSLSLANRTLLQMDQTTSPHQQLFRHFRQQRQDPRLDCLHRLCVSRNRQEPSETQARPLRSVTDPESHSLRENA